MVEQLWKSYGGTAVLRGVSVSVAPGAVVAVTGPSGSGKSTLLRLISGDEFPDRGVIRFGRDIWVDDEVDLGVEERPVGRTPQAGELLADRNVGANIALGLPRRVRNSRTGAARVAAMFDLVGLPDEAANRRPPELSISERQRVALARALVDQPAVLLLDEPFYAFDPETTSRFAEDLGRVLRTTTTATILVTHDEHDVTRLADEHHRLVDGRLVPGDATAV